MSDSSLVVARVRQNDQTKLWIPSLGEVDTRVTAAQRVVHEYDERLVLARHEVTRDWVVFVKTGPDSMYPVIGLGPELPNNAEDLRQRLWRADTKRHGDKRLREINAHNQRIRDDLRKKNIEIDEEVAQHFIWGMRREGALSKQIFVPRDL